MSPPRLSRRETPWHIFAVTLPGQRGKALRMENAVRKQERLTSADVRPPSGEGGHEAAPAGLPASARGNVIGQPVAHTFDRGVQPCALQ